MKRLLCLLVIALVMITTQVIVAQEPTFTPDPDSDVIEVQVDPTDLEQAAEDVVETTETVTEGVVDSFVTIIEELTDKPENDVVLLAMVIGGVLLLVGGWRIYEYIVVIAGILVGALFAVALVADESTTIQIFALIIGALLGAALSVFLYYIAVFFIGAYLGMVLLQAIANALDIAEPTAIALLVAAIIGGIIAVGLGVELLVVLSAVVGAQMLVVALGLESYWILILAIIGIVIQVYATRYYGYSLRRRPRSLRSLLRP
jgi:hypothetical protein